MNPSGLPSSFQLGPTVTSCVCRSAFATPAPRRAAITSRAFRAFSTDACLAVTPSVLTPNEKLARSGTELTEAVPVTVTPCVAGGAEPWAEPGRPTPAYATAAASSTATTPIWTIFIVSSWFAYGRYAAGRARRHIRR